LIRDPNGKKRVQWTLADGSRATLRLGKVQLRIAEAVRVKVEALLASFMAGAVDAETARWVASLEDGFHLKLARLGLVQPRAKHKKTIADLLDAYFEVLSVKPGIATTYQQTC